MPVLPEGTLLNHGMFVVGSLLSTGGFGEVYLGHQRSIRRDVAIKVLKPEFASDDRMLALFQREALAAGRLRHPNVLPVIHFDFDHEAGVHFLAVEYVPGGQSLMERLGAPFELDEVARLVGAIAGALDAAHAHGIVHRDVKPANVLLDGDRPLLTDFGIAHLEGQTGLATSRGMGTGLYMAPERWDNRRDDGRSDQYSLGVITYELLAGRPPFAGDAPALGYQHVNVPPPPLAEHAPHIPAAVEQIVFRAMSKRPEDRFRTCGEFAAALATEIAGIHTDAGIRRPAPDIQTPVGARPWASLDLASVRRSAQARWSRPPLWPSGLRRMPLGLKSLGLVSLPFGLAAVLVLGRIGTLESARQLAVQTGPGLSALTQPGPPGPLKSEPVTGASTADETEDPLAVDRRTAGQAWLQASAALDGAWAQDWPLAIAVLDLYLTEHPQDPAATAKLYAALVEHGRSLIQEGLVAEGASQVVRAQALAPDRGEAASVLLALTPTAAAVVRAPPTPPAPARQLPTATMQQLSTVPALQLPAPTATLRPPPIGLPLESP